VAVLLEVCRHAAAHNAQSNESNFYFCGFAADQLWLPAISAFNLCDLMIGKIKISRTGISLDLFGAPGAHDSGGDCRVS
jgi:hypothetical protein